MKRSRGKVTITWSKNERQKRPRSNASDRRRKINPKAGPRMKMFFRLQTRPLNGKERTYRRPLLDALDPFKESIRAPLLDQGQKSEGTADMPKRGPTNRKSFLFQFPHLRHPAELASAAIELSGLWRQGLPKSPASPTAEIELYLARKRRPQRQRQWQPQCRQQWPDALA